MNKISRTDSIATLSADLGTPTIAGGISTAAEMAFAAAGPRAVARYGVLAQYVDTNLYRPGLILPGSVDCPPALPTPENTVGPEIPLEADLVAGQLGSYRATKTLSLEKITKLSPAGLERIFLGIVDHLFDGIEEELADHLVALGRTPRALGDALDAAATATSTGGGSLPMPSIMVCASSLRLRASIERWSACLTVVENRFLPKDSAFLVPRPENGALFCPLMTEPILRWTSPGPSASWRLATELIAGPPQSRPIYIQRVTCGVSPGTPIPGTI